MRLDFSFSLSFARIYIMREKKNVLRIVCLSKLCACDMNQCIVLVRQMIEK